MRTNKSPTMISRIFTRLPLGSTWRWIIGESSTLRTCKKTDRRWLVRKKIRKLDIQHNNNVQVRLYKRMIGICYAIIHDWLEIRWDAAAKVPDTYTHACEYHRHIISISSWHMTSPRFISLLYDTVTILWIWIIILMLHNQSCHFWLY